MKKWRLQIALILIGIGLLYGGSVLSGYLRLTITTSAVPIKDGVVEKHVRKDDKALGGATTDVPIKATYRLPKDAANRVAAEIVTAAALVGPERLRPNGWWLIDPAHTASLPERDFGLGPALGLWEQGVPRDPDSFRKAFIALTARSIAQRQLSGLDYGCLETSTERLFTFCELRQRTHPKEELWDCYTEGREQIVRRRGTYWKEWKTLERDALACAAAIIDQNRAQVERLSATLSRELTADEHGYSPLPDDLALDDVTVRAPTRALARLCAPDQVDTRIRKGHSSRMEKAHDLAVSFANTMVATLVLSRSNERASDALGIITMKRREDSTYPLYSWNTDIALEGFYAETTAALAGHYALPAVAEGDLPRYWDGHTVASVRESYCEDAVFERLSDAKIYFAERGNPRLELLVNMRCRAWSEDSSIIPSLERFAAEDFGMIEGCADRIRETNAAIIDALVADLDELASVYLAPNGGNDRERPIIGKGAPNLTPRFFIALRVHPLRPPPAGTAAPWCTDP